LRIGAIGDWLRAALTRGGKTMRNHMSIGLALGLAVIAAGCTKSAQQSGSGDSGGVKQALKADEKKWNEDFKSKDLEALLGHYSDDAYFVAPGVKPASGSMDIRKAYAAGTSDPNFEISFASDKIDAAGSGDLAYARGRFTEKFTDPKTQNVMTDSGSYLTVYKKQSDGSWKAVEDFAVADPDSTKPVEPGKPVTHAKMVSGM
jgi:uncharacterized protein (TIGR02246 family)